MNIITTVREMQEISKGLIKQGETIGYVPTMGYLHEGHLALLKEARKENSKLVLSIFVNPLQFGPNEDFESYPRDIKRDEQLAKNAGVDYLFYPSVQEMYPGDRTVELKVTQRTDVLCGKSRVGHFDGVATVLLKLFSIIRPVNAYFGLKDAQQVAVVEGLIKDFNLPVQLKPVSTIREEDGLAKSSRNVYLTETERIEAKALYGSLKYAQELIETGERQPELILSSMKDYLLDRISGEIDYIEIHSYPELEAITRIEGQIIIAIAVKYSKARLIDNIVLTVS